MFSFPLLCKFSWICNFAIIVNVSTVKPVLNDNSERRPKIGFKTDYRLMQVKSIEDALRGHSTILLTFIKLPFVIEIFLSIFE